MDDICGFPQSLKTYAGLILKLHQDPFLRHTVVLSLLATNYSAIRRHLFRVIDRPRIVK